jgi:hypothetical protein
MKRESWYLGIIIPPCDGEGRQIGRRVTTCKAKDKDEARSKIRRGISRHPTFEGCNPDEYEIEVHGPI